MKRVKFSSVNGTPLSLTREDDGEVCLRIHGLGDDSMQADVYIDVEEMIAKLQEVARD